MKLNAKQRKSIPSGEFGLPAERKYPIPDKGHAVAAKSRATQQEAKGNLTPAQKATIDRKANAKLDKKVK